MSRQRAEWMEHLEQNDRLRLNAQSKIFKPSFVPFYFFFIISNHAFILLMHDFVDRYNLLLYDALILDKYTYP